MLWDPYLSTMSGIPVSLPASHHFIIPYHSLFISFSLQPCYSPITKDFKTPFMDSPILTNPNPTSSSVLLFLSSKLLSEECQVHHCHQGLEGQAWVRHLTTTATKGRRHIGQGWCDGLRSTSSGVVPHQGRKRPHPRYGSQWPSSLHIHTFPIPFLPQRHLLLFQIQVPKSKFQQKPPCIYSLIIDNLVIFVWIWISMESLKSAGFFFFVDAHVCGFVFVC